MKDSESTPNESVEQHSGQSSGPRLQTCPNCDVVGLPERIATHDCRPSQFQDSPSHEHTEKDTTDHTTRDPTLKLNTTIVRQREADHTTSRLEITWAATTGSTLTLRLISNRESTTVELTPQQAVRVADILQTTAIEIVASELPENASQTTPNMNATQDTESTSPTEPTLEVFKTDD